MRKVLLAAFLLTLAASAQTAPATSRSIIAVGTATMSVTPDMALVDVGVTTRGTTAQDASTQNATMVSSVLAAIHNVIGSGADIKTISYSVVPVYNNPPSGQSATITGYTATNIVEATLVDLTLIGKVIDAAIAAGANKVQGIQFGLRDPNPALAQALKSAAAQAVAHAAAIASGLGVQTGRILHATQGSNVVSTGTVGTAGTATAATPVDTGLVQARGTVTIEVEITT